MIPVKIRLWGFGVPFWFGFIWGNQYIRIRDSAAKRAVSPPNKAASDGIFTPHSRIIM